MTPSVSHTVKIKMYPAKNGDAFLISASLPEPVHILIDGGYQSTYKDFISPDLIFLASKKQSLDVVVATHIDSDHISGLIEFFRSNLNARSPEIIPVEHVLHNSLRSINSVEDVSVDDDDLTLLKEISNIGFHSNEVDNDLEISAKQGSTLAALLLGGSYKWNLSNGSNSINTEDLEHLDLSKNLKLEILSPSDSRLQELKTWWIRELQRLSFIGKVGNGDLFDDAFEFLCAQRQAENPEETAAQISESNTFSLEKNYSPDTSLTNACSIAFIANIGEMKLLFMGDAWAEDIELQLEKLKQDNQVLLFDAIKISHHGSSHNTSPKLLTLVDSPAFFISTDGSRHNHPNIEVLTAIVDRPCLFIRNLYFSHSTPASVFMRSYKSKHGSMFVVHENANNWIELTRESL